MPLEQPQLLVPKELTFPEEAKLPDVMNRRPVVPRCWRAPVGFGAACVGNPARDTAPANSSLGAESSAHVVVKGASNTVPGRTVRTSIAWTYHHVGTG